MCHLSYYRYLECLGILPSPRSRCISNTPELSKDFPDAPEGLRGAADRGIGGSFSAVVALLKSEYRLEKRGRAVAQETAGT